MNDINAGSVSVEVVPDARGFAEKLKAKLGNLAVDVIAKVRDDEAKAKLDALTRDRDATINADANTTAAGAKLDEAARDRTAHIEADTTGAERNISNLTAAIVGLGPALVPITVAAGGLALALAAPVVSAGGGLTIFGFLAGKAISDTVKVQKQIDALGTKLAALTDPKARAQVQAQMKVLEQSLTGPQKAFLAALDQVKAAYADLTHEVGPALFDPFTTGLRDVAHLLPTAAPLLRNMGSALGTLVDDLDRSARSGSMNRFLHFVTRASGPDTVALGHILGNVASGLMGIVQASHPLGGSVLGSLERMTGTFSKWGQNAGANNFQDFLKYVRQEGPHVARLLFDTAGALGAIARDAAPIGGKIVDGLDAFANILHRIADTKAGPTLFTAAAGFVAVNKAMSLLGRGSLLGSGGRASLGGIAAGTVGKGVVPVYVTNLGPGGLGGKGGGAVTAAEGAAAGAAARGAGAAEGLAGSAALARLFGGAGLGKLLGVGGFSLGDAGNEVRTPRALPQSRFDAMQAREQTKALNALGLSEKMVTQAANGNTKAQAEVSDAMSRARDKVQALNKEQGTAVLRTQADVEQYNRNKHELADLTGAYNTVRGAVDKATAAHAHEGAVLVASKLKAAEYNRALASLPKKVQTAVTSPGAVQSYADVKQLARQYNLTPKQVRTIIQLDGVSTAAAQARAYAAQMAALNGRVATTYLRQIVEKGPVAGGGHPVAARASGGPVAAGLRYLVGETGAEMFVPKVPGSILPAAQTARILAGADRVVSAAPRPVESRVVSSGPLVAHFYGADNVLIGTMRGEVARDRAYAAARARQRVGA